MRIAVLASHEGRTLQAVVDACSSGVISGEVVGVISNNGNAGALRRARMAGIRAYHLSSRTHPLADMRDRVICETLVQSRADVVLLAGFMKKLGPRTLSHFRNRIINTHPALLPKYGGRGMYGSHVHRAVLEAGETKTGASIHLVTGEFDEGPVVAQFEVEVRADDTTESLAERVQLHERKLVVETLRQLAEGALTLRS